MNSPLVNGSFYHVYNRGVEKRTIFKSVSDYYRFLETLDFYHLYPTPRKLSAHLAFKYSLPKGFIQNPLVSIVCYCLMPNHFHLLVQQLEDGGISEFIRRIQDSYTRFFNTKYQRIGPLFQGKFKAKIIEKDEYLLYLSKYIHRNPLKLKGWNEKLEDYTFSSYPGYLNSQLNKTFCNPEIIKDFFENSTKNSYRNFVEETEDLPIPESILIDDSA